MTYPQIYKHFISLMCDLLSYLSLVKLYVYQKLFKDKMHYNYCQYLFEWFGFFHSHMIGDMDTFLRGEKKRITNSENLKYQLNKTEKYQNTNFFLIYKKSELQKIVKHNTESTGQPDNFPICKESFTEKTDF